MMTIIAQYVSQDLHLINNYFYSYSNSNGHEVEVTHMAILYSVLCLRFIAVTHGKHIKVWHAPDHRKEFAPFTFHRTYTGFFDDTVCIDWSADSR